MSDDSTRRRPSPSEDEAGLHDILAPSDADRRDGVLGLRVEDEDITPEQARRRRNRRKQSLVAAVLVFVLALVVSGAIVGPKLGLFQAKEYDGNGNGTDVTFTVSAGETNQQIAQGLEDKGVVADAGRFVDVFEEKSDGSFIQPGTFQLQERMSSAAAVDALLGTGGEAVHYVAINQTLRKDEAFKALADGTGIPVSEFEQLDRDPGKFGIPSQFPSLEGYLHPGEYRFKTDATAEDIIREMVDKTKADLKTAGVSGDQHTFDVLTIASILEFEATPQDYPAVAGAIHNRIDNPGGETNGYLQSDATVAYGLGEKTYQITAEQKQDASNRYNTFANKGLPEGPIGSPGLQAIQAAQNPQKNDYYYWVTVNLDTGETKFAKTYAEHQKNVEEYQSWCSDHEGKCS
ncbi:endolytic transglycosylase MltG [Amycolatopsis sp. H6(2020)]|nr:endolytic transglycosylase MltG [Amycolatopsis sp. H6(2020)]